MKRTSGRRTCARIRAHPLRRRGARHYIRCRSRWVWTFQFIALEELKDLAHQMRWSGNKERVADLFDEFQWWWSYLKQHANSTTSKPGPSSSSTTLFLLPPCRSSLATTSCLYMHMLSFRLKSVDKANLQQYYFCRRS